MNDAKTYPLVEAVKAHVSLREAAGLPPEQFPIQAFVGMISDEIEHLRKIGKSDDEIATIIERSSEIRITGQEIADLYVSRERRQR